MACILIIDDDLSIRQIVSLILARVGHSVIKAADGTEGAAFLRSKPIDLVITDLIMPGGNGIESIVGLRRDIPDLPIVAMSGAIDAPENLRLARKLGAGCTLPKPFTAPDLLGVVDRMLRATRGDFESVATRDRGYSDEPRAHPFSLEFSSRMTAAEAPRN